MKYLYADFETRSRADLRKVGAAVYARDPSTEILCAAWAYDDGSVETWCPLIKQGSPDGLVAALNDPAVLIVAHNAGFEREIISHVLPRMLARRP